MTKGILAYFFVTPSTLPFSRLVAFNKLIWTQRKKLGFW